MSKSKTNQLSKGWIVLIIVLISSTVIFGAMAMMGFNPLQWFTNLAGVDTDTPTTTTPTFSLQILSVNGTDISDDLDGGIWDIDGDQFNFGGFVSLASDQKCNKIVAADFEDASGDALTVMAINVSGSSGGETFQQKWALIYSNQANVITMYQPFTQSTLGIAILNASTGVLCEGNHTATETGNITIGFLVNYDEDKSEDFAYEYIRNFEQEAYQTIFVKFTFNSTVTSQDINFPSSMKSYGEQASWLKSAVNSSTEFFFYFDITLTGSKYMTFEFTGGKSDVVLSSATWGYAYESGSILYSKSGNFAASLP